MARQHSSWGLAGSGPAARGRPKPLAVDGGLLAAIVSAAAFGSSGPFAKSLMVTGWAPPTIVTLRIGIAALVLLGPALWSVRGRWEVLRAERGMILAYGLVSVAGCQVAYFNAVARMPVGVALLLEYLGILLVVLWVWLRTRRRPHRTVALGGALAVAGLVLVLDVAGAAAVDLMGVVWGLAAAVGLAVFFVLASRSHSDLPAVALAGFGMLVGTLALLVAQLVGALPAAWVSSDVTIRGMHLPWYAAILELALVAAAAAYLLGTIGARALGSTVASFVGLTEVLFAVVLAWLLLGEFPGPVQLVGGVLILAGVVAVRVGELRGTGFRDVRPDG